MPETSPTQPSGLRAKLRALIREVSKFGTVGAVAFTVDTVLFNVLGQAGVETLIAKTGATVVSTTVAFCGNRFWTWRRGSHTNMARQYTLFFGFNAVGLGIALACLAISHYGLGEIWPALRSPLADNIASQLVGNALGTLFRFWSYRRFVFRATASPEQVGTSRRPERRATNVTSPSSPLRDSA